MGVIVPNFASSTEDRTSGALVIDGGLRFDTSKKQYLTRTVTSTGNRRTFTYSTWIKLTYAGSDYKHFGLSADTDGGNNPRHTMWYTPSKTFGATQNPTGSSNDFVGTSGLYRDYSGWYHVVMAYDLTQGANANQLKIYVNGVLQTNAGVTGSGSSPTYVSNQDTPYNTSGNVMEIGRYSASPDDPSHWDGHMAQIYWIDGQQLDASYFGYTDPLTNTWRPKKLTTWSNPNGDGVTWSGFLSNQYTLYNNGTPGNGSNAFDYSLSTYAMDWNGIYNSNYSYRLEFIPTTPISFTSQVRVYTEFSPDSPYSNNFYVDTGSGYGSAIPHVQNSWVTVATGPGQLYKLKSTSVQNGTGWNAIQIDGVILVNGANRWGQNGFYLPFDGSAPIGQDQSGRGNNWTPVNFGGSNTIEKATGALPILNTDGGGKVARVGVRTDSNASSLVLALPLVGNANDISATIKGSGSNKTITVNGNAAASSVQSNFYGGSFYFDGSGDYLSLTTTSDFAFGTGDFTIEFWAYVPTAEASNLLPVFDNDYNSTGGVAVAIRQSDNFFSIGPTAGGAGLSYCRFNSTPWALNTWNHFAMTSNGGIYRAFINGNEVTTSDTTTAVNISRSSGTTEIGRLVGQTSFDFGGYLQDLRIYKGVAKYTQNFIPASTDPDILPDTPSGVSYSSNVALVPSTDGAVAFDSDGDYLTLTSGTDFQFGSGNFTVEAWIYPNTLSNYDPIIDNGSIAGNNQHDWRLYLGSVGEIWFDAKVGGTDATRNGASGGVSNGVVTKKWQHIAVTRSGNIIYTFLDGVQVLSNSFSSTIDSNYTTAYIGADSMVNGTMYYFDGFISNLHIVKGTALYTSNFTPPTAPITSVANTKLLCCKSNSSATAFDVSPGTITANGNATATNFNPFTTDINTVRGQESGYATLNPLANGSLTLSNGNLTYYRGTTDWEACLANFAMDNSGSGKWYFEVFCDTAATGDNSAILEVGIALPSFTAFNNYLGTDTNSWTYQNNNGASGQKGHNNSFPAYGVSAVTGDTLGVSLDLSAGGSNGVLTFYKNGISMGYAYNNLDCTKKYFPAFSAYAAAKGTANFGQKPFKFPPPAGFQPLALANTPRPTIVRPDQYVGVTTYNGNGGTQQITYGFQPDLIFGKPRNATVGGGWNWVDSVRGNKYLMSQSTNGEADFTGGNGVSFNSTGIAVTDTTNGDWNLNGNYGGTYVGNGGYVYYGFKAGGNKNTYNINDIGYSTASAAGLPSGDITPTGISVNTKSGFSIVRWTNNGNTTPSATRVAHGLGNTPKVVITKSFGSSSWAVKSEVFSNPVRDELYLETTGAIATAGVDLYYRDSSYIGFRQTSVGTNGTDMIAYCWAEIPGFSKFGSYTGSSTTNFVNLGFKPAWVMIKNSSSGSYPTYTGWAIFDATRNRTNTNTNAIFANKSQQEGLRGNGGSVVTADFAIDLLSNGFCLRDNGASEINLSGNTYFYMAFAESPSFNLYGGQANAR